LHYSNKKLTLAIITATCPPVRVCVVSHQSRTCDTDVIGLQIALQLDVARPNVVKVWFNDVHVAASASSASTVHHLHHVRVATDEAEVRPDTATETLAAVESSQHQYDVTAWTARSERLEVAVLIYVARR